MRIAPRWLIVPLLAIPPLALPRAADGIPAAAPDASPAPADSAALRLTLDQAIRLGLERNPAVRALDAETRAADAGRREARAARWPRLVAETAWHRTDHQVIAFGDRLTAARFTAADFAVERLNDPGPAGHAALAAGAEIPLFTSGRLAAAAAAARESAAASRAGLRAARAALALRVTEAYFGVALARGAVEVAAASLRSARGHETTAGARVEGGMALRSDLLRARVERLARERDLERATADEELARARLRHALGLGAGESVETVDPLEPPRDEPGDRARFAGGSARPEIEAARRAAGAAAATLRAERARLGPEAVGTVRYERNSDRFDAGSGSFFVGVGVRWSAFDAARAPRLDAADARAAAALERRRAAEADARLEVEAAWLDVRVAGRNLDAAREAVEAADEARRIAADRYAAGLLPITDLLDTETALMAARLAELGARYEAVVGRSRLRRAAGIGTDGPGEAP